MALWKGRVQNLKFTTENLLLTQDGRLSQVSFLASLLQLLSFHPKMSQQNGNHQVEAYAKEEPKRASINS